jgi:hypothetical protein
MHAMTSLDFRSSTRQRYPCVFRGLLELSPAVAVHDRVIALVALLVALVHHRRSHSVALGNRTRRF